jgi:hypothetical protein
MADVTRQRVLDVQMGINKLIKVIDNWSAPGRAQFQAAQDAITEILTGLQNSNDGKKGDNEKLEHLLGLCTKVKDAQSMLCEGQFPALWNYDPSPYPADQQHSNAARCILPQIEAVAALLYQLRIDVWQAYVDATYKPKDPTVTCI